MPNDPIVNLADNITINLLAKKDTIINQTICQGASYLGYNTTGTFIDTFATAIGCDSIRTLNLIVNPINYFTVNQTICQPNSYLGYSASGTFIDTFQNQYGCDSIRTLNLIVKPMSYSFLSQTICQGQSYRCLP
jgi:acyl carrier protein